MDYFKFNRNEDTRNKILAKHSKFDGKWSFNGLSAKGLQLLIKQKFADPQEMQNNSPSIEEFLQFLKEHPDCTVSGYAVELAREDYRVSVEQIDFVGKYSKELLKDFVNAFRNADEFKVGDKNLHAWWD